MSHSMPSNSTDIQYNGRVLLKGHEPKSTFSLYEKKPVKSCTNYSNALTGTWSNTPLSIAFFSTNNITIIQNGIRKGVYDVSKSQYLIGQQSEDVLKVIMRSTFLQFAKHSPTIPIVNQITELNTLVLDYAIRQIYGEVQGYLKYLHDVSTLATPMARPVMTKEYKPLEMTYGF